MLVEFRTTWFAPTETYNRDKITALSGKRYRAGVHEVPDSLFDRLPSSAKVVDGHPEPEVKEDVNNELFNHDHARAIEESEERKEKLRANLAKAREAKAAKKAASKE